MAVNFFVCRFHVFALAINNLQLYLFNIYVLQQIKAGNPTIDRTTLRRA